MQELGEFQSVALANLLKGIAQAGRGKKLRQIWLERGDRRRWAQQAATAAVALPPHMLRI